MMRAPPELSCLRCQRCGGVFELVEPSRDAVCPYCRSTQEVPAALLRQLVNYDARAQAALAETAASATLTDRVEAVERGGKLAFAFYVAMLAVTGGSMLAAVVFFWDRAPGATQSSQPLLALQLVAYALLLAALALLVRANAKPSARVVVPGRFPARCPNCGACDHLLIGQVHHTCSYCRANLVPSGAVMAAGLSVASARLRDASLERLRASRRMYAGIGNRKRSIESIGRAWIIVLPLGASVVFAHHASRGTVDPAAAPFWAAVAAAVALFTFVQDARVRKRRERVRRVLELLVRRDPAAVITVDTRDIVAWINAYYPEPYGKDYEMRSTGSVDLQAASLTVSGFPVLLVAYSPAASHERFVDCLIAAVPEGARVSLDHHALGGELDAAVIEGVLQNALARVLSSGARPAPRL